MRVRKRKSRKSIPGHLETCGLYGACECMDTAYHEAGHAVMAWALRVRLVVVDVRSLRGAGAFGWMDHDPTTADKDGKIMLAGEIAETIRRCEVEPHQSDEIGEAIGRYGIDRTRAFALETRTILRQNWPRVVALAQVMIGGRTLIFGSEAKKIIETAQ